jgi:protein-S-isoprenylcysteine O-methyltransferase Ste14
VHEQNLHRIELPIYTCVRQKPRPAHHGVDECYAEACDSARQCLKGEGMKEVYNYLVPALWLGWGIYWIISASDVKVTERRESVASRLAHLVPLGVAAVLMGRSGLPIPWLYIRFLQETALGYFLGAILVACGLGFSVWARVVLGRNWSGTVTLKQGHELIRHGPYRWVRHPIYSGLLLAFLGMALACGQWRGVLALGIVFAALWGKLRHEERWMSEAFAQEYAKYRSEVAALIPFVL